MLDRDHLGVLDIAARAQRLRPPGPQLRGDARPRRRRRRGRRDLHPRAVGARGRRRRRGARRRRRPSGRRPPGRRARRVVPPGADRRDPAARMAARPSRRHHERRRSPVKDSRVEALAQILVRYSTKVQPGDVCVIQGTTTGEPLIQAVYEEILRAGGLPVMQLTTEAAQAAFFELANERAARLGPAARRVDRRARRRADRRDGRRQPARAVRRRPGQAGARLAGAAQDHGDLDAARRRGRAPLVADAVPDPRLRRARPACRWPPTSSSSTTPAWRPTPTPSPPGSASPTRSSGSPTWIEGTRGGPHHRSRHRHQARRRRPPLDPLRRHPQHARRRVLHRAGRGLGQRRDHLLASRRPTAAARSPASASASWTARSSTRRPSAARTS